MSDTQLYRTTKFTQFKGQLCRAHYIITTTVGYYNDSLILGQDSLKHSDTQHTSDKLQN